jgi:hypothetical protein
MIELVAFLRQLRDNDSRFHYDVLQDELGQLIGLFWSSVEMQELGARYGDAVLEDVTFCTNSHGLYLSCAVQVTGHRSAAHSAPVQNNPVLSSGDQVLLH